MHNENEVFLKYSLQEAIFPQQMLSEPKLIDEIHQTFA